VCLRANHTSRAATPAASGFAGTIGGWQPERVNQVALDRRNYSSLI
jgi:hypothetical protein